MIRLGVFDLHGTLLTSEDRLPEHSYSDVELPARRGVSAALVGARPAPGGRATNAETAPANQAATLPALHKPRGFPSITDCSEWVAI